LKIYKLIYIFIFIFIIHLPITAKEQNCRWYPFKVGLKIKNKKNLMIYSTSQVKVFFDDFEEIQDAYMEAENNAIVQIVRFLQTDVKYNKKYFLLNDKNSFEEGESKKETAKSNFDSEFSLSGIKIIKQCYEKNKFVKVTVLLDEKSIKKANKMKTIFLEEENK
tara:strand:+ start:969 stop:1460 length:492 start_codon:yes stop_codon:yes gene_type:complete